MQWIIFLFCLGGPGILMGSSPDNDFLKKDDLPEWAQPARQNANTQGTQIDTEFMNSIFQSGRYYDPEMDKYYYIIPEEQTNQEPLEPAKKPLNQKEIPQTDPNRQKGQ